MMSLNEMVAPVFALCECGHKRIQHIYGEGACRPGFVCEKECKEFKPTKQKRGKQMNAVAKNQVGGGIKNRMPAEFKDRVKERPEFLDRLVGRSERKARFVKVAEAVKALGATQTIHYTLKEFTDLFGGVNKNNILTMRSSLKSQGIPNPRVVVDEGIVYIW